MHTVFVYQKSFQKFLTHIFILDLDTLPHPVLHDLINITERQNNSSACEPEEKNEIVVTFPDLF